MSDYKKFRRSFYKKINKKYKKISNLKYLDIYLFFLSIAIIISIKFIQFPSLTINAEMFAENGTNFFINAYGRSLIFNLTALDAGYLPLMQRFFAVILVKVFGTVNMYPFYSQLIAITFIAVMSSLVNLKIFRNFGLPAVITFILGIAIGLISDYELNAFINFAYYGIVFLLLVIFVNKEKLKNNYLIFFTLFSILIILSKGQFIILAPTYLILSLIHYKRNEFKSLFYYISVLSASIIQFIILSKNSGGMSPELFQIPYLMLKTVYYFVLTYRHVFFGYISKEGLNFIAITGLFLLLVFALRKILINKDRYIIYIFLIGNLIAFSSLSLTVLGLNSQTSSPVSSSKATEVDKSVSKVSNEVANFVYDTGREQKNIFDIKHFANLRSLFISNLLIFIVGMIVILYIFPRNSQKIIVLLFFCFTSGAFFQIKVEEAYSSPSQSYSQWKIYSSLLANEKYCIPVNHYSFLLKKNCDYLYLFKSESTIYPQEVTQVVKLSDLSDKSNNWMVQAVIIKNNPSQLERQSKLILLAYDKDDKLLGSAKEVTSPGNKYNYFLFQNEINSPEYFIWKDVSNKTVNINPTIIIFGRNKDGSDAKVRY